MKIAIGIATNRHIRPQTTLSLLELINENKQFQFVILLETEGIGIEDNRNQIAERAIESGANYLLFIDDDMVFNSNLITDLLRNEKEVVGVASRSRTGALTVKMEGIRKPLTASPLKVRAVGTGIMLIDMNIFKQLPAPYFKVERYKDNKVKTGEDVYFCDKVNDAGGEVWCDPRIEIKHIGDKFN